ncbi:MAG: ATP-binding protein [Clostridia bacterium]|nr:ATP-binding protein [Clostridia bacterium]
MDNSLLKQVLKEYDEKRTRAVQAAEERKKDLMSVNPRLQEIDKELTLNSIQTSKAILVSDSKEKASLLASLKKKNNSLIKEKNDFIKNLSKENNYLNPHFDCKLCKDTGYVQKDGKLVMCSCLKQRIFDIAYNKSNMGNLERENFSSFNIRIFSDKPDKALYKSDLSPRENMQIIREKVKSFIENFDDPEEKNLIFTGNTGVGKTFLTNCIANEMLKLGKTVLYQTAPVMFDEINDAKFGRENARFDLYENILNVDLLIIDDLGTEKITDSKVTELFTIINTRLLNQNHKITKTIISTNLNVDELFKTYTTRIGSRLAGNYRFLRFFGDDLRFKKAKKEA